MSFLGEASASQLETQKRSSRKALVAVAVSLAVSVTLNVLLAHRVRSLNLEQSARFADRLLKIGAVVPPIAAKRLDGQQEMISYYRAKEPTVLYIFTPPCIWCARNMDNFKTLLDREGGQYRFIGLSLSEQDLAQYVAKNELKLTIYSGLSAQTKEAYKLSGTPQTIVVSPEGKVLEDWSGAYVGSQKSQIEAFFHVTLPGLRTDPEADKVSRGTAAPTE